MEALIYSLDDDNEDEVEAAVEINHDEGFKLKQTAPKQRRIKRAILENVLQSAGLWSEEVQKQLRQLEVPHDSLPYP